MAVNAASRKEKRTQINNLPSQFKDLEKEEKLRASRRKEIINSRVETDRIKKTIKTMKARVVFFFLEKLTKSKRLTEKEKTQPIEIRNESG